MTQHSLCHFQSSYHHDRSRRTRSKLRASLRWRSPYPAERRLASIAPDMLEDESTLERSPSIMRQWPASL